MPWCEECHDVVEEEDLDQDGSCPACGTVLTEPGARRIPWYVVFLVIATVIYLVYRCVQGVLWLTHHV